VDPRAGIQRRKIAVGDRREVLVKRRRAQTAVTGELLVKSRRNFSPHQKNVPRHFRRRDTAPESIAVRQAARNPVEMADHKLRRAHGSLRRRA